MHKNVLKAAVVGFLLVAGCSDASSTFDAPQAEPLKPQIEGPQTVYGDRIRQRVSPDIVRAGVRQLLDDNDFRMGDAPIFVDGTIRAMGSDRPVLRPGAGGLNPGEYALGIESVTVSANAAKVALWLAYKRSGSDGWTEGYEIELKKTVGVWSVVSSAKSTGTGRIRMVPAGS